MPGNLTLATMKARIAAEIFRGDLTDQIANAIIDAIDAYQGDRFWFNEPNLTTEPTFNTVVGQSTYTIADLAAIESLFTIDYLTYVQGNSTFSVTRRSPQDVQLANQNGQVRGPPDSFTYAGSSITLYPVPDNIYPVSFFGMLTYPAPATDAEVNNIWMNEAEVMIRSRAKWELATHVTRNDKMAQAMSPDQDGGPGGKAGATYRAWQQLKQITTRRTSLGRISAMQF